MRRFLSDYADFLRLPGVGTLVVVALFARMPVGMVGFAMLMFLRDHLGTFALAGSAVGAAFIAMAVAAPVQGRLIDRFGPAPTLWVTGFFHPASLLAVLFLAQSGASFPWVAAAAAASGLFASPIIVLTRTLWRQRFENEDERRRAFSLDAVMIELNFATGPAIMAGVLALAGSLAAFSIAIGVVVTAFATFMASPVLRHFRREPSAERHPLGPLVEPRLLLVFLASMGLTTCFGITEVGYPAFATALSMPALGGVLISVNSLGSVLGGVVFGGLALRASIERQFAAALGLMAIPLVLHVAFDGPLAWAAVAFLAGLFIAPCIASQSVLVSRYAPARYATEAFTWSSTFIVTGLGAGMALGGVLAETAGVKPAFASAGAIVFAMSLVVLLLPAARRAQPLPGAAL